jgi:hypothetical protein
VVRAVPIARQRRSKQALSTVQAVFSVGPVQIGYKGVSSEAGSSEVVEEREREWSESSAVKEEGFG